MAGIAERAALVASLDLDTKRFDSGAAKAVGSLKKIESTSFKVGQDIGRGISKAAANIKKIGIAAGVGVAGVVALGVRSLGDLQRAQAQTEAVIKSTGGSAKVTAAQVRTYAENLENLSTVDDKVIQDGENLLLTFTNIGSETFPAATKAALDMAVAMAGGNVEAVDLKGTAIRLGKALNDPAKGFTVLSKAGVSFTDAQKKVLKGSASLTKEETKHYNALRKSDKKAAERFRATTLRNKQIQAQRLILAELNKEFGKAGEAAGKGPEAVMRRLQDAGEGLSQVLARGVLPVLEEFGTFITEKLSDKGFLDAVDAFGRDLGTAGRGFLDFLKGVDFAGIKSALGTAAGFAKDLMGAFLSAPAWLQTAVITGWGLNKLTGGALTDIFGTLASGLIKGVLGMNAGVVNINAAVVNAGGLGAGGAAGAVPGWSTAGGSGGGLTGLMKGIPIIGAAIAGAEFANVAGNILADKIKQAAPGSQEGGDFGSGVVKVLTGALTGAIGIPTLVGGLQDVAGAIGHIVSVIGKPVQTGSLDRPNFVGPGGDRDRQAQLDAINAVQTSVEETKAKVADELANVTGKTGEVKTEVNAGASRVSGAMLQGANSVAAAVRASRPITNVEVNVSATTVQKTVDVITRYGPSGGDRDLDSPTRGGAFGG